MTTLTVGGLSFTNDRTVAADGNVWVMSKLSGWHDGPPVRGRAEDRPNAHGVFGERAYRGGRAIAWSGAVLCPSRAAASSVQMQLAALMAEGEFADLTVADADQGALAATVRLALEPVVDWDANANVIEYAFTVLAPDPLRYGAQAVSSTSYPQLVGGLEYDLYTSGSSDAVARTNLSSNPSFETGIAGPSGVNVTLTHQTSGGFVGSGFLRAAATTTAAAFAVNGVASTPVTAGAPFAYSAYVRGEVGRSVFIRAAWTGAATTEGAAVAVASASAWQRISFTGTVPAGATAVRVDVYVDGAGVTTATTVDVDAVLAEAVATLGTYFDGSTTDASYVYRWSGTAHASTSTAHVSEDLGYLDYGIESTTGVASLANTGTADSWPQFEITGPVDSSGFEITTVGSGARLVFEGAVPTGSRLLLDSATGAVLIDGTADRSGSLTYRDWAPVQAGATVQYAFTPRGASSSATLVASLRPAFW